jgi:tripartite-type tricarboxylate transporter receptor subunit TctC
MRSFVEYVKAQRDPLPYATVGAGSAPHLMMEKLQGLVGAEMTMVPYRGDAPATIDLAAGHLECMSGSIQSAIEPHRSGDIRILAITGPQRAPVLPDVPTLAEAGFPELTYTYWQGLGVRAGTPPDLVRTLHAAILQGLDSPNVRNRMSSEMTLTPMTPQAFAAAIRADQENWRKVVQERNVYVE